MTPEASVMVFLALGVGVVVGLEIAAWRHDYADRQRYEFLRKLRSRPCPRCGHPLFPDATELHLEDVPHPGAQITEYLESRGWAREDLALRTGLTLEAVTALCDGKASITPATAELLEDAFERPAHLWLSLQRLHDESRSAVRNQGVEP